MTNYFVGSTYVIKATPENKGKIQFLVEAVPAFANLKQNVAYRNVRPGMNPETLETFNDWFPSFIAHADELVLNLDVHAKSSGENLIEVYIPIASHDFSNVSNYGEALDQVFQSVFTGELVDVRAVCHETQSV